MNLRQHLLLPAAASVLALAACASAPVPTAELSAARTAIQSAESAGAATTGSVELNAARDKLQRAQTASARGENVVARRLAEEGIADAQLAQAKASSARSREGLAQAEQSLRALRDEVIRSNDARMAPSSTTTTPPATR